MSAERKPGERWRFTFEGTIDEDGDLDVREAGRVRHPLADYFIVDGVLDLAVSSERLPDPEPDWQLDDICEDAEGKRWLRVSAPVWVSYPYDHLRPTVLDVDMARPLTPVMLGGKHASEIVS